MKQLLDAQTVLDVDEVGKTRAVIVDEHDLHWCFLSLLSGAAASRSPGVRPNGGARTDILC
jgi:hypothetical protein